MGRKKIAPCVWFGEPQASRARPTKEDSLGDVLFAEGRQLRGFRGLEPFEAFGFLERRAKVSPSVLVFDEVGAGEIGEEFEAGANDAEGRQLVSERDTTTEAGVRLRLRRRYRKRLREGMGAMEGSDECARLNSPPQGSLSEVLCLRHIMTTRSGYAEKTEAACQGDKHT